MGGRPSTGGVGSSEDGQETRSGWDASAGAIPVSVSDLRAARGGHRGHRLGQGQGAGSTSGGVEGHVARRAPLLMWARALRRRASQETTPPRASTPVLAVLQAACITGLRARRTAPGGQCGCMPCASSLRGLLFWTDARLDLLDPGEQRRLRRPTQPGHDTQQGDQFTAAGWLWVTYSLTPTHPPHPATSAPDNPLALHTISIHPLH